MYWSQWRTSGYPAPIVEFVWWRYHIETFTALQNFCAGNSTVTFEFHSQRCQATILINAGILLIGLLGIQWKFDGNWYISIHIIHLKVFKKWRPIGPGLNVLIGADIIR